MTETDMLFDAMNVLDELCKQYNVAITINNVRATWLATLKFEDDANKKHFAAKSMRDIVLGLIDKIKQKCIVKTEVSKLDVLELPNDTNIHKLSVKL